ncbi:cobalt-precorrin-6A reductase [Methylocella sp.]|uniref:cobalt-precorrin-6A reductase n=1 Tax=Methylocella sp. TaxID=1978226 RepID=UPI0035ADC755
MRLLLLGGVAEANALAALLAARPEIEATLSLAGRTSAPAASPLPTRVGGFGGADGLAACLRAERIDLLVDATHPFAQNISRNAAQAAREAGVPLIRLVRPPWRAAPGDRWLDARDMEEAARLLGAAPRRVFLAIGRQQLAAFRAAPQHFYLVRAIEPVEPGLPNCEAILARGPFSADAEEALLQAKRIDVVVAKNSGSPAVAGKLAAARRLKLPVVMVARPALADGVATPQDALGLILAHAETLARRGVST